VTGLAALRRAAYADQGAGGATPLAYDDFARADAATLGTSTDGHLWDEYGTAWSISGGRARPPVGAGYRIAAMNAGAADVDITASVLPSAFSLSSPDFGLVARSIDINNFVFFDVVWAVDHWLCRVFQRVGGTFTGITSQVNPVPGMGDNDDPFTARLVAVGDSGEAFLNGASVGTWSGLNATLLAPTWHGLAANDSSGSGFADITVNAP
jgi:hypothetical protein